jgi:tetratricopeptide (TPR) repeat protein
MRKSEGQAIVPLGMALQWQADFNRSIPHLNQAIEFAGSSHEGRLYGPTLLHLGSAYLSKGEYEEALRCYGRFAEYANEASDKMMMAVVANLPGGVHLELYDFDEALKNSLESYLQRPVRWCFLFGVQLAVPLARPGTSFSCRAG